MLCIALAPVYPMLDQLFVQGHELHKKSQRQSTKCAKPTTTMKRLFSASVALFFLPAILVLRGMRWLAFWLIR
jgi:hypothetical protein